MLQIENLKGTLFGPVDLCIAAGECVAIRGASGAGKSLLLRAIADLDPNEGDVSLNGRRREAMPAPRWRRLVGLVPAESGWWDNQVGEHFDEQADLPELLDAVGMPSEALNWDVARLSTGERHRLALIRCLALRPAVLLLDEPTAALDGKATARIEQLLQTKLDEGAAILMVTHDPEQARRFASRLAIMEAGQLAHSKTVTA